MNYKKFVNLYTGLIIAIIIILSGMALMSFYYGANGSVNLGTVDVTYNNTSSIYIDVAAIQTATGNFYNLTLVDENKTNIGQVYVINGGLYYDLPAEYCLKNEEIVVTNVASPDKAGIFRTNVIYPVNDIWLPDVYVPFDHLSVWLQNLDTIAQYGDMINVRLDSPISGEPKPDGNGSWIVIQHAPTSYYTWNGLSCNNSVIVPVGGYNSHYNSTIYYFNENDGSVAFQKLIVTPRPTHFTFKDDLGMNYQNFTINNSGSTAFSSFMTYIGAQWFQGIDIKPMDNVTVKLDLNNGVVTEGYVSNGTCYFNLTNDMFVNGTEVMIEFEGNDNYGSSLAVFNLLHNNTDPNPDPSPGPTPDINTNNTNDTNNTVDITINDTNSTVDILKPLEDALTDIGESLPVTGIPVVLLGLLACIVGILTIKR
ncbi:MAG: hypothetical protein CfClM3_1755 [Methanobrevibacter sp. CfCl-M3]